MVRTVIVLILFGLAQVREASAQLEASDPQVRAVEARMVRALPVPLTAVRLTGGPLKEAQDADAAYLLSLDPDRVLAALRLAAGLDAKARPLGGWDGAVGRELTGHIAGHALSALSLMYVATGDQRFKNRVDYMVRELAAVQAAQGDGYIGAQQTEAGVVGKSRLEMVSQGVIESEHREDLNGLWAPWYVEHKLLAGLRDAFRLTGNAQALEVEKGLAGWIERTLAPLSDAQIQRMLATEFGGMNETLVDLYADTGDQRWLDFSYEFEEKLFVEPLARGEDMLDSLHGNTSIPKMIGSLDRYTYVGSPQDLAAADFFWHAVVEHHSFATGGNSAYYNGEHFPHRDGVAAAIESAPVAYTNESCNVYNMLKLTRRLFSIQPRPEYADYLERALLNHALAQIDPSDGALSYHVPVGQRVRHDYQPRSGDINGVFSCCVGTGLENAALFGSGLYYETNDELWVNLYVPSTAEAALIGAHLTVESSVPEGDTAWLTVGLASPRRFTLALRRPYWTTGDFTVTVNRSPVALASVPAGAATSTYVEVTRTWHDGDVVEVVVPKRLRLEATQDKAELVALLWGPLVLGENLGPASARGSSMEAAASPTRSVLYAASRDPSDWLEPVAGRPDEFRFTGKDRTTMLPGVAEQATFVPLYKLHQRTYSVYVYVAPPGAGREWQPMKRPPTPDLDDPRSWPGCGACPLPLRNRSRF